MRLSTHNRPIVAFYLGLILLGGLVTDAHSENIGTDRNDGNNNAAEGLAATDAIEQELMLQRAIAESLKGNAEAAIEMVGDTSTDDTATMYSSAVWMMSIGRIPQGIELLEQIASRDDAPEDTQKMLAVGYLHEGNAEQASQAANEYLQSNDDAYVNYVQGLAKLRTSDSNGARVALHQAGYDDDEINAIQQVVMQVPVDVTQRRSTIYSTLGRTQRRSPRNRANEKFYNVTLLLGQEYDSNVPLQPRFSGLGSDVEYEDSRFLLASFLDLQLLTDDLFNIGLLASTYNTFQYDLSQFNIQDYMGGAYANGVLIDNVIGSLRYEYHHTLVDEIRFASEHRLTPSLTRLGQRGHTTVFYEFNPIDANAPALIPAQEQSADIHRVGVTQALYTARGNGRVYAGYQYADALADGSDFDRSSHMVTGRYERPLCCNWIMDLDVRYIWDDYDNPNSLDFFDRARDDDRVEVRAGLQRNFAAPVSLRLDYTYINNDSNTENLFGVRFYDYDRHLFATQLIFSF